MSNALKRAAIALGFAEEEELAAEASNARSESRTDDNEATTETTPGPANVTPLRRAPQQVNEMHEILTVHPRQYKDAKEIAGAFRDEIPVIINLSQMTDSDARRLIDFAAGLTQGLNGKIERVTTKVYLLSPESVTVSGSRESENDTDSSVFNH
ncbi:cell division protein SepF [uncultured Agrococcus sp.]|uniref:cell division protein SepF n=1 Tax=uncultured Agrococcus sp. TaxID=382258 RepID=UPI0025F74DD6|nr:cell division protein SepF [uncultured Agrococcus sp.]